MSEEEIKRHDLNIQTELAPPAASEFSAEAQTALKASREYYADLYNFAPVGYLTLSLNGLITGINHTGSRLLGIDEGLQAEHFSSFVVGEDQERWARYFMNLSSGGQQGSLELGLHRAHVQVFHARLDGLCRKAASGEPQIRMTLSDITDRKLSEAALRESEARFRFIVDKSPGLIWVTDVNEQCSWFNKTWLTFTGRNIHQELGNGWIESVHVDDLAASQKIAHTQFDLREPFSLEYRLRRHDGEYRWILCIGQPRFDENGAFKGYVGTCLDTTENKQATEAIRESKALLQDVIDSTPDWICVKDREHRFMLVNQQFAKAFKQSPAGMIGRRDTDFIPDNLRFDTQKRSIEILHSDDDAVFSGQTIHRPEDKVFFENGDLRVFESSKRPMRDSSQAITGNLCIRRDITERFVKDQAQELLETQLRQAQKMELIGHLTGGIAHDFNNILAAVFGYAELIQMSPEIERNPQLSLYIQEILQAGIRAKELVAQLLTFSHRREVASQAIDVTAIIAEVAKLLRVTMPTSISIECSLADSLPAVLISPVQLHQILMNLGVNARDAMANSGTVQIRAEHVRLDDVRSCASCHANFSGHYLLISVRDNGSGIAQDKLSRIFDPFFTTKEVGRGSGLGLSVLHGIVHSANGHIEVITAPGKGTEFRIYLSPHENEARILSREIRSDAGTSRVHGTVMVVDDEASIVRFMTVLLENLGCRVIGLTSSSEALKMFQENPRCLDLLMTDQTMPELSGVELARAMLAGRPDLPIMLSTGYSNAIEEDKMRQVGIRRFLMKPVPAKVLADIVAEYLAVKT